VRTTQDGMIDALRADGPFPEHAAALDLFGRLIGSWDIKGVHFDEQGREVAPGTGEWHFGWVLEGRVIEDVIISPPRQERGPGITSQAYDIGIRAYDPKTDTWRVTIVAPIFNVTLSLTARANGDEIWQDGIGPFGKPVRWNFDQITRTHARWQEFVTEDDGLTWRRDEVITLTRRGEGSP
jgi:hypothetical protein